MEVPQAIVALASDDALQRAAAAERLAQAAEDAKSAAVPLVRAAGDADESVREWAVAALESLGAPPTENQMELAALLSDPRLDVAYWSATLLGRLGAEAKDSTAALAQALQSHPEMAVRQQAAQALAKIGRPAASAVAALQVASSSADPRLARVARQAMEAIQGS